MSSLTPQEAGTLLGVTVRTLHRWELDGKIKSTRTAGGHLYGSRSHKNKKIVEELKEVAKQL